MYGVGAEVDESGAVTKKGKINGTVIVELSGWNSHTLTTLVFSILLAEVVRSCSSRGTRYQGYVMSHLSNFA